MKTTRMLYATRVFSFSFTLIIVLLTVGCSVDNSEESHSTKRKKSTCQSFVPKRTRVPACSGF